MKTPSLKKGTVVLYCGVHPQLGQITGYGTVHRAYKHVARVAFGQALMTVPRSQIFEPFTLAWNLHSGMIEQVKKHMRSARRQMEKKGGAT